MTDSADLPVDRIICGDSLTVLKTFPDQSVDLKRTSAGLSDVWYIPHEPSNAHPAPFPVEIPRRIISATNAEIILDPFSGSGTTAVAAKELGRHYIGIEISPDYCAMAKERIAKTNIQMTLL